MLGPTELLIVLGIVMLMFGSTRLPKLARSLGEAQRELRSATAEVAEPTAEPRPPHSSTTG
jgi:sec-independent protein translocase protein TatA